MAELLTATVELIALAVEGEESPELDKKGLRRLADELVRAGPAAQANLGVCTDAFLDQGSHWSVRIAAIEYVRSWFTDPPPPFPVTDAETRTEAVACLSRALEDENSVVRSQAQTAVDWIKGGGSQGPAEGEDA